MDWSDPRMQQLNAVYTQGHGFDILSAATALLDADHPPDDNIPPDPDPVEAINSDDDEDFNGDAEEEPLEEDDEDDLGMPRINISA